VNLFYRFFLYFSWIPDIPNLIAIALMV